MAKRGILALLLVVSVIRCAPGSRLSMEGAPSREAPWVLSKPTQDSCDGLAWTYVLQTPWTVRETLSASLVLPEISGRIVTEDTDGEWPGEFRPLFECRATGQSFPTYRVFADKEGRFAIKGAPAGRYCFHISCFGWHAYFGTLVVDRKADPGNRFELTMARERPRDSKLPWPMIRRPTADSPFEICDTDGLSPADYMWDQIDKPFIVKKVKGTIGHDGGSEWPLDMVPLVELRAVGKGTRIYRVFTDSYGRFSIDNIPDGRYCLNANMYGWNACLCTVIVDRKADRKKAIDIKLNLAT